MQDDDLLASVVMEEILSLAKESPTMTLYEALSTTMPGYKAAHEAPVPSFTDAAAFGVWTHVNCPDVVEQLMSNKKIHAIKDLRVVTGCGLKEAKEAVEYVQYTILKLPSAYGHLTPHSMEF